VGSWEVGCGCWVYIGAGKGWNLGSKKGSKTPEKKTPGRGVLQKSTEAYRNSVHFLPFFRVFSLFCRI